MSRYTLQLFRHLDTMHKMRALYAAYQVVMCEVYYKGSKDLNQKIPQHIAIIMDGNGRWAQNQGLPRREGHLAGVVTIKNIVKACVEKQIRILSLWAFGQDNWSRPADEVAFLMELFVKSLAAEVDELHQHGICLRFTGDKHQLSPLLRDTMSHAESLTASDQTLILNIVMNYGGKWDILQAVQKLGEQIAAGHIAPQDVNETLFSSYLSMADLPDPDLFIRTSGEQRISNFFLWQLSYTELYFSSVCWPDFTIQELEKALSSFQKRERRYGKISAQIEEESMYV